MDATQNPILHELYRSLDARWRPEDVAQRIVALLKFSFTEDRVFKRTLIAAKENRWSSMSSDFDRPTDMARQLEAAERLFGQSVAFAADDLEQIDRWMAQAEASIGKEVGHNDFQSDRLPASARKSAGIGMSRRQYNKRFRVAARLERKVARFRRELFKRSLALASKNRLASRITWEQFSADTVTACFIAYYVARCNLRSVFTNTSQARPFDQICEMLFKRCEQNPERINWLAIACVLPNADVLRHLSNEQKGTLLAEYFGQLHEAAMFLKELWSANRISDDLVVRRGNDSTTWNLAAGAWNKLREGWFALMFDLGMTDAVKGVCPGKVLRLMAGDVAYWHKASGGTLHPDTAVWRELPRPWEVLSGTATCSQELVETVCRRHGVDPVKSGWTAPKPGRYVERFSPTPELVHGVAVGTPLLASIFRKAGVFSGQKKKGDLPADAVHEVRSNHAMEQERRKTAAEKLQQGTERN